MNQFRRHFRYLALILCVGIAVLLAAALVTTHTVRADTPMQQPDINAQKISVQLKNNPSSIVELPGNLLRAVQGLFSGECSAANPSSDCDWRAHFKFTEGHVKGWNQDGNYIVWSWPSGECSVDSLATCPESISTQGKDGSSDYWWSNKEDVTVLFTLHTCIRKIAGLVGPCDFEVRGVDPITAQCTFRLPAPSAMGSTFKLEYDVINDEFPNVECKPETSVLPTRVPMPTVAPPAALPSTAVPAPAIPSTGVITDFEYWGTWQRGDQSWGTFEQSTAQVRSGSYGGKFAFDFPAVKDNFVVYQRTLPIPGRPSALTMWVYGDTSAPFVNAWVRDAQGILWQFTFGRAGHSGWQQLSALLDTTGDWPTQRLDGGAPSALTYPLELVALVVDGVHNDIATQGVLYFDDLAVAGVASAVSPPAVPVVPAASVPPTAAPASAGTSSGVITDFESWGTWRRGDEAWGTFEQSREQVHSGSFSGKFAYNFPAVSNNYVVYQRSLPIPGKPAALSMWVYGDASAPFVNAWVRDAQGSVGQFTFGRAGHSGWKQMTAPLDLTLGWPNSLISGSETGALAWPLELVALVVDGTPEDRSIQGVLYFDDLAVGDAASAASPTTAPPTPKLAPAATPAPTPVPAPAPAPAAPQVSFRAEPSSVAVGGCSTLRWDVDNVKAVYLSQRGSNNEAGVTGHATQVVCVGATSTYDLRVLFQDGSQVIYTVFVSVNQEAPPVVVPPTAAPPPVTNPYYAIWADTYSLNQGECTTVRWETARISALYFGEFGYDMQPVVGVGSQWVCPGASTMYALRVVKQDGSEDYPAITITVAAPAATNPTPTPIDIPFGCVGFGQCPTPTPTP